MKALVDLLTTDYGLMSAAGLVFMVGMGIWLIHYFIAHMKAEERQARARIDR